MVIISFLLIFSYIAYCIITKGIPHSLSLTYYDNGPVFSVILTLSTALILPRMLEITPINYLFLAFLSLCGTIFIAFAPNFNNNKLVDLVHTGAAIIALISSLVWVGLIKPINLTFWIPIFMYGIYMLCLGYKLSEIPKIKFIGEFVMLLTVYDILWKI